MNKKLVALLSFILLSDWVISQKLFDSTNIFYPSVGVSIQRNLYGDIGLCYGSGDVTMGSCASDDIFISKVSSEFTFDDKSLILGPKFSVEYIFEAFGGRINVIDYTDFKQQDWRITPEAGISVGGLFDIFYGYNIPLTKDGLNCVSRNRVTLTINLPNVL